MRQRARTDLCGGREATRVPTATIRFRGNIKVTAADGGTQAAVDWVGKGGRMRSLRGAAVTAQDFPPASTRRPGRRMVAGSRSVPSPGPLSMYCRCTGRPQTDRIMKHMSFHS
jgi:hypothetical protein